MKPGYKTTEFWLSLTAIVIGTVMPYLEGMPKVAQIVGIIGAILTALGYTTARTSVKNNDILTSEK